MKSLVFLNVFWIGLSLAQASSGITFHGRIVRASDNSPLESPTTEFRIRIKSPGIENCTLWQETQTKDMSNSGGVFSLMVGDPAATVTPITNSTTAAPFTLPQVFANGPNYTGLPCGNYNSLSLHGRIMEVSFRETIGVGTWEDIPPTKINYIPLAYQSVESEKLGGRSVHEFLKIASYPSQVILSNPQVDSLLGLVNGTSTTYLRPSDSLAGDVTGSSTATVVARIRGTNVSATAPTLNQVLKFDGTNWVPAADDAGAAPGNASYIATGVVRIDTDLATSGLNITGGVLSMPNVGTAGTYGSSSLVPVMTTDAKGRVTAVTNTAVDDTTKLPLAGGTMTGSINMGLQNITNATSVAATNFSGRNLILNDNDTNTATIRAPTDITANYALTLPANDGDPGQVLLTDGAGVLSWGAASGGTVTSVSSTNNYLSVATGTTTPALTLNVGTAADTVAAGNDSRITGAVQQTAYAADLAPAALCTNVQTPYWNTVSDAWACQNIDFSSGGSFVQNGNSFGAAATMGTNDNFALNFETNNTTRMTILNNGYVGIGDTNPQSPLRVSRTTANTGGVTEAGIDVFRGFTVADNGPKYGVLVLADATHTSGNIPQLHGVYSQINRGGAGTVAFAENYHAASFIAAGSSVNNLIGYRVSNASGTGTVSTQYGIRVENLTRGSTNYAVYTDGSTNSYFGGSVGIGALSPGALLQLGTAGSSLGTMRLTGNTSGYVQIQPSAAAGSWTMTLPANDGDAAQVLTTDGSGVTSWTTVAGGASTIDALSDAVVNYTDNNMFIGQGVGASTTGDRNTGLGTQVMQSLTSGGNNTAVGNQALQALTTGGGNTAIGRESLLNVTTGASNTAVGLFSLANITTGSSNTGVGDGALSSTTVEQGNTAVGRFALLRSTGWDNTSLGLQAGANLMSGSNNIYLGINSGPTTYPTNESDRLYIHNQAGNPTIFGDLANRRVGLGGMTDPSTTLDIIGAVTQRGMAAPGLSPAGQGRIYFDSGTNRFRVSQNGGAYTDLVSSGGLSSLNGLTTSTQTFEVGTNGTDFDIVSSGTEHTFHIPTASSTNNRGLLNSTDWTTFNNKLTSPLTTKGDLIVHDGVSHVRLPAGTNNYVLSANSATASGLEWITAATGTVTEVTSANAYLSVATGTTTPALTLNVGTAANTVAAGDDTRIVNAVQQTAYAADLAPAALCTSVQTPYWNTVSDAWACQNINFATGGAFVNNGNTFAGDATLGTNDSFALNLETNNTTRMTITNAGDFVLGPNSGMASRFALSTNSAGLSDDDLVIFSASNTAANHPSAVAFRSRGTVTAPTAAQSGDVLGGFYAAGFNGTTPVVGAGIVSYAQSNFNSSISGSLRLFTVNGANDNSKVFISPTGQVAIGDGVLDPSSILDINGAFTQRGMAAPGVSPAGQGRIYFDSGLNRFRVSQNGGAYADLVSSGGATTLDGLTDAATNYATTYNMFLGQGVGASTTGTNNTGVGAQVLQAITTGSNNTAFGNQALQNLTSGNSNTAIGREALLSLNTGQRNTSIGLYSSAAITSGADHTVIGDAAMTSVTTASGNTAIGGNALNQTTGGGNVALGMRAGSKATGNSFSNVFLGYMAGPDTNTADVQETLWIHNYEGDPTIYGNFLTRFIGLGGIRNPSSTLDVNGAITQRGMAAPAVSPAGQGRLYYDSGLNRFRVSQNGGAYEDLVSSGGTYLAGNGTSGAPSFSFTSDPNTGFYRSGEGEIGFSSNGGTSVYFGASQIIASVPFNYHGFDGTAYTTTSSGSSSPSGPNYVIRNNAGGAGTYAGINLQSNGGTSSAYVGAVTPAAGNSSHIVFGQQTGANAYAERMRLDTNGRLGIGTTSPTAMLEVGTAGTSLGTMRLTGNTSGFVQIQPAAAAGSWTMTLPASAGTSGQALTTNGSGVTSWTTVPANGGTFLATAGSSAAPGFAFSGDTNTGFSSPYADAISIDVNGSSRVQIDSSGLYVGGVRLAGTSSPNPLYPYYAFYSDEDTGMYSSASDTLNFTTGGTERMRISSGGAVSIGNTSTTHALNVTGSAGLSTGTAWTNTSDRRLKDIHGDYEYGLNEILKLNTVRFNYKKNNSLGLSSDHAMTGFIAQEVQKVIPDAVTVRDDGYLELNVDPIHWATVNAVQDLHGMCKMSSEQINKNTADISEIKREIASLKEENSNLKLENEKMKKDLEMIKKKLGF